MGTDLVARNAIKRFRANWSAWRILGNLLNACGADVAVIADDHDGGEVSKGMSIAWADALDRCLGDMYMVTYTYSVHGGGERIAIQVDTVDNPIPYPPKPHEEFEQTIPLIELEGWYSYVTEFSEWLRASGGFKIE